VGLARDREQVQDGVRGARDGHHHGDRVLERLLREDLPRPEVHLEHLGRRDAAFACRDLPPVVDGGRAGRARQRHAERLAHGGHRVRRVHPGARPRRRARGALDRVQIRVAHRALRVRADRLEHVLDRDVPTVVGAGQDRAAVQVDAREVHARHRHQHAGLRLVAAGDADERVQALRMHHEFHRVGDQVARHQRRLHALVSHRDAVGDRDRRELDRHRVALPDALLREGGELVEVVVARRDLVPARGHGHLRLAEVVLGESDRAQHRARRRALGPVGDFPTAGTVALGHGDLLGTAARGDSR
jgi:hypothetical protein